MVVAGLTCTVSIIGLSGSCSKCMASADRDIVSISTRLLSASVDVTAIVLVYRIVLGVSSCKSIPLAWLCTVRLHVGQVFCIISHSFKQFVWKVWLQASLVVFS